MKTFMTGLLCALVLGGLLLGQEATPNSSPQTQNPPSTQAAPSTPSTQNEKTRIAPGSVIPVQLTKSVDAKKAKSGDQVEAQVTEDLKAQNGEIIVPKKTKVIGRVTEAQPRNKEQKESQVGIAFDHAIMKNGGDISLPMSIQAIVGQSYLSSANNNGSGEGSQPSPPAGPAGTSQGNNPNRSAGSGTAPSSYPSAAPNEEQSASKPHQPITGNTQGVLGIADLKLSTTADASKGSVISSEKNNVKLEGGTLLLLRVNQ